MWMWLLRNRQRDFGGHVRRGVRVVRNKVFEEWWHAAVWLQAGWIAGAHERNWKINSCFVSLVQNEQEMRRDDRGGRAPSGKMLSAGHQPDSLEWPIITSQLNRINNDNNSPKWAVYKRKSNIDANEKPHKTLTTTRFAYIIIRLNRFESNKSMDRCLNNGKSNKNPNETKWFEKR